MDTDDNGYLGVSENKVQPGNIVIHHQNSIGHCTRCSDEPAWSNGQVTQWFFCERGWSPYKQFSRQETPNSVGSGRIMYDNVVVVVDGDDDDDDDAREIINRSIS